MLAGRVRDAARVTDGFARAALIAAAEAGARYSRRASLVCWHAVYMASCHVCYNAFMHVLALLSLKGGSGKTTTALHLAVAWQRQGRACAVLDLDPQASACAWGDRRPSARPAVWPVLPARLARALDAAQRQTPPLWAVVLDTPGRVETPALAAARAAQVCAITCRPTMLDLLALEQTLDVCRLAGEAAPVVILTQCPARGPQTREAAAVVTERSLPLAPSLGARVAFAHAVTEAQGVTEYQPAGRAAREIDALAHWLAHALEKRHGQD